MMVGFILVKANILTMETSRDISNMVVNTLISGLTFNKVVGNLSRSEIKEIGVFILITLLIFVTGFALACVALFLTPVPHEWRYGILFAGLFPNTADLPIAYVQRMGAGSIFTSKQVDGAVALNRLFLVVQQFLIQNCGMFLIVGFDFRERNNDGEAVREIEPLDLSSEKEVDPELESVASINSEEQEIKNRRFSLTSKEITRMRSYEPGGSLRSIGRIRSNTVYHKGYH
jgi:predicted permease